MTYSTYRKESITYNNKLNFQIIDINGNDEFLDTDLLYNDDIGSDSDDSLSDHDDNDYSNKQMKYIINMYGVDSNSQSIYVKIHDFKPYFYIEVPETWTNTYINEFKKFINQKYTDDALKFNKVKYKYDYSKLYEIRKDYLLFKSEYLGMKIVKKKKLYFFNNYKKFNFIRLTFSTKRALYSFKNFVDKDVIFDFKYKNKMVNINHKFAQYETNIDPCIRFIHEQNIEPSNWVSIKNYLNYPEDLSPTSCQFNCSTTNIHVVPYVNDSIAPLIIASFDIECTSESGAFPNAENDLDKIIQIGTVFSRYGEKSPFLKTMITLGECSKIDNCKLYQCMTEKEVLLKWTELMCDVSPDIVTGYNIFGFDYKYMYARAAKFKIEPKFSKFSKLLNKSSRLDIKKLSSSALGDNTMYVPDTPGTVQLDLMKVIQADHNLNSYKLDNVASTFMRGKITKYVKNDNSTTIFTNNLGNLINNNYITIATQIDMYLEGKKFKINNITKLEKGGSFEIDYVINDDLVSISWTEAKDDVSPQEIFNFYKSGDPDKIKDVAVYCIQDCELCIRLINKLSIVSNKIGMANVCSVPLSYLFLRGQGVKIFSLIAKQCMNEHFVVPVIEKSDDNSGYEGAIVLIAKHGIYLDNPIAVVDYSSLYPSSMISENLSHDSIVWIYTESNGMSTYTPENWEKYDNLDGYEYETIEYDLFETGSDGEKVKTGLQRCRYVQPLKNDDGEYINESRAIMPRILQKLLKARKDTRKKIPSEPDPFKKDVLNGLQLAYKVTCNSLYGQLGARTSPVFFKEIAASTTATGRKLLKFAKDQVESKFQGEFEVNGEKVGVVTDVVYGDTDSTFNRFRVYKNGKEILKKDALPYCIKLGQMAGQHVTKQLKHPHDLEYEKTFYPFILFSKKRYVGELYELDPNKISYRNSMGIVLKRRDNAPVLKKIYGDIIDTIMTKQDLKLSEHIIKDEVEKLLNGEYPLSNFIISKTLKSNYKNPQSIAHVVLADRIKQRDPGNAPQSNDRIPYIYIKIDDSKIKKQKIMKIGDLITEYRNIIKNLTDLEKKYKYVDILLDKINNVSLMGNKNEPEKDNNTYFIIRDLLRTAVEKSHSSNKLLQSFQSLIFEICKKKVKIVQGDRIESPDYIKQNSDIEIDYNFYLTNQVLKPVSQIFALEIEQLDGFSPSNFKENKRQEYTADLLFKKMIDKYKRKNINTLDNYFFIKS